MHEEFGTPECPANRIEAEFWKEHAARPYVYELFKRFTAQAIASRRKTFSVSVIIERIRWETMIGHGDDDFKINNNYRAYYGRLWMREHPEHDGFFRTRELRAGPAPVMATEDFDQWD